MKEKKNKQKKTKNPPFPTKYIMQNHTNITVLVYTDIARLQYHVHSYRCAFDLHACPHTCLSLCSRLPGQCQTCNTRSWEWARVGTQMPQKGVF